MSQRNSRQQRVATQMQRTLAELLPRAVKDPRVGRVTITGVSLLDDFSSARVWFLPFGQARATEEQLAGLQSAAGFLRGELARQLRLRHAPRLEFCVDTAQEQAQALSTLIDTAVSRDRQLGGSAAPEDGPGPDGVGPAGDAD
jgi:ribosome-binding factor A